MIAESLQIEVALFEHRLPPTRAYRIQWTGEPTKAEIEFAERSGLLENSDIAR